MNSPQADSPAVRLDASGHIDQDCACVSCGYNLRGLDPDRVCPECATPISRSIRGDYLRFSDPKWVRLLASGMNWVLLGLLFSIMSCFGYVETLKVLIVRNPLPDVRTLGIGIIVQSIYLVGFWAVTTPDPAYLIRETEITMRRIVRLWGIVSFVVNPIEQAILMEPLGMGAAAIILSKCVVGVIGFLATSTYFVQLARRIPDHELARQTRVVMWGLAVCLLLILVGVSLLFAMGFRHIGMVAQGVDEVLGIAVTVALIGFVIFSIWTIVLAVRYRTAFRKAAEQARVSWASETR